MELTQSPEQISETWKVITFDFILAQMGGYAAFIWFFVGSLIDNYNKNRFEINMVEHLFTKSEKS